MMMLAAMTPAHALLNSVDQAYLDALYISTNGPNWTNNSNWYVGDPCLNQWYGVICNAANTAVEYLAPYGNNLVGTLPPFPPMPALQHARFQYNQLTGPLPDLSPLTGLLTFQVNDNQFSGTIPPIAGMPQLRDYVVSRNLLTGSVPSLAGLPGLFRFEVDGNQLTGSLPPLDQVPFLSVLIVSNNQLSGALPAPSPGLTPDYPVLCPNFFIPEATPPSANDVIWTSLTTDKPWSLLCTAAPPPPPPPAVATPQPIPTMSQYALAALSMLLGALGVRATRRRAVEVP